MQLVRNSLVGWQSANWEKTPLIVLFLCHSVRRHCFSVVLNHLTEVHEFSRISGYLHLVFFLAVFLINVVNMLNIILIVLVTNSGGTEN